MCRALICQIYNVLTKSMISRFQNMTIIWSLWCLCTDRESDLLQILRSILPAYTTGLQLILCESSDQDTPLHIVLFISVELSITSFSCIGINAQGNIVCLIAGCQKVLDGFAQSMEEGCALVLLRRPTILACMGLSGQVQEASKCPCPFFCHYV